ncbi:DUF6544 family protein [Saccharicrinis sp. FJH2]|uniref:DUF6544 family protein n=1 Tax=Saccharicrinis sp. FJH65 TaxID=3344659 RepID=UPI0035F39A37
MKQIALGIILITTNLYSQNMEKVFNQAVAAEINKIEKIETSILTEQDMTHLPDIVKKYLKYVGAVGKEKVLTLRAECSGGIRNDPRAPFMKIKAVQYNFYNDNPARLFYIVAKKIGLSAKVAHIYRNETASMKGKLLGIFTIVDAKGEEANKAETVTVFNDICLLAPALLISKNIEWSVIDSLTVKAKYTNRKISIEAKLFFDNNGRLINFTSKDRYETKDGKVFYNYPWQTPVIEYKIINELYLPSKIKTIFIHPDIEFCYGEFEVDKIEYNCLELK